MDVQNAQIGLMQARAQFQAAAKAVRLQQETLDAEQKKLALGASTIYNVILAQRDYVTAQSNQVTAQAAYARARVELDRSTGQILTNNNVSLDEAYPRRRVPPAQRHPGRAIEPESSEARHGGAARERAPGEKKGRIMPASTRRFFMGSLAAGGASATLAAQARRGITLPKGRISPLDGVSREKIKITGVTVTNLAYRLKPEEEWPDSARNSIIYKTESVIVEISTDVGLKGIGGCSPLQRSGRNEGVRGRRRQAVPDG